MEDIPELQQARERLLTAVARELEETAGQTGWAGLDSRLAAALRRVPRHAFVDAPQAEAAYRNQPLAIGHGQTVSQPFIVALMTALLALRPEHTVLEIGTGSGYQAAVLACLARQVYSIEVIPELAAAARERLLRLGFDNVEIRQGDGYAGWTEHAPFDAIIVTAAAPEIPEALVAQLRPGGRMVVPVGRPWWGQDLVCLEKSARGVVSRRSVLPVSFVPLVHAPASVNGGGPGHDGK